MSQPFVTKPFYVIIPARYASTRLPGKPLQLIADKPMIQHVYERAMLSAAKEVIVATDDARVEQAVKVFGGKVVMTRADHQSGTDRIQEVCQQQRWDEDIVVVNLQGDEPLVPPEIINQVAKNCIEHRDVSMATLCETINDMETFLNPNAVKVVMNAKGRALYFSRASIPWPRDSFINNDVSKRQIPSLCYRHIGIYAYRVSLLNEFVGWPVAPLEDIEKLEQLRVMWQGHHIHVEEACANVPGGVDTPEDLRRVRDLFSQ